MPARIEGNPTDTCRTTLLQTDWPWMQYGPAGGGHRHQHRILGVVAESAMTMLLTRGGDVYVEDASGHGREIEGIRRSESRALPS